MGLRSHRPRSHRSGTRSTLNSSHSYASEHSRSTTPTVYSERPTPKRHDTYPTNLSRHVDTFWTEAEPDPRASVATYASTTASAEDLTPQPQYEVPLYREQLFSSDVIPTKPAEFAELFEAGRRIHIEHDDSTSDGNLNLCLNTEISVEGKRVKMGLFHLRMRDLRDRQFSLRRHCRDSGREVCKSYRKYRAVPEPQKASKRPPLQCSLGSAISSMMGVGDKESARLRRHEVAEDLLEAPSTFRSLGSYSTDELASRKVKPTNTIRLEFVNYALVEIHASGTKSSKRYNFEYWGNQYYWRRQVRRDGCFKAVSYHLFNVTSDEPIAHITPELLTPRQAMEEEYKGGWVPPCSLFIADQKAFSTDLADVIVATGLVALVDDCIMRRWHNKGSMVLNIPTKNAADYITPNRLIDEIFNRRSYTVT